ncbi:MAG: hypothetical protein M1818_001420 [Claussenomyces sp. TS43310]|nr:MAG: hypothetical protein M1818_001420 [Claussenomyces sp. TS43310]
MGICSSCLGRSLESPRDDESSRLLSDDPNTMNYGGLGEPNNTSSADPQHVQRENEALQKVVAQTSNHLVDIFAMVPQNSQRVPSLPTFSGHDARLLQYRDVLAKLSNINDDSEDPGEDVSNEVIDWLSDNEEEDDLQSVRVVKPSSERLLGGFADVERANV